MFRKQKLQRATAALILTTFTTMVLNPAFAAMRIQGESSGGAQSSGGVGTASANRGARQSSDERLAELLGAIHEDLKAAVPAAALSEEARRHAKGNYPSADHAVMARKIRASGGEIKRLYADIEQSFKDTEKHLHDAKLPQEIFNRHNAAVVLFQTRKVEFERLMLQLDKADDKNSAYERRFALTELGSFMAKYPNAKLHQYTDPNKLPFGTNSGKVRAPNTTKEQYQASLFPPKYKKVLLAGPIPDGLNMSQVTLPSTPNAADLAETEDVQITRAIKDQASALGNNPVKIYNWVRNNISFIPSYGSIQGSDMTLQNKRGNAFDTASLLIAMYRAAGIPARYVYGTIDVPAAKVMNWVGGVTKPEAVQSLLGQGGIPNIGLISGGAISAIRMEHVWVEAYVDYTPSRGAVHKNPNTWMPIDASFKQYEFTNGMDLKTNVIFDGQALLTQIQQGATSDATQGYVQNLNQTNLETKLANYQMQVQNYVYSQKANPTVGDVLGTQTIKAEKYSVLLGSLPYRTVAIGNRFQTLPDNLRWKFKTNLYLADGISISDDPIIELRQGTPKLAGKKITLSFLPATRADQDLINSYLPKPHTDGTPIQPSELPTSLPGYLLQMKAEIRVEGQVEAQTADSFTMGSTVKQSSKYFNPASGTWEGGEDNDVTVGEYNAIGMDLQGLSATQLKDHQAKLEATRAKLAQFQLNPNDASPISGLTKEDLTGDIVQTGILDYFAQVDTSDSIAARTAGNVTSYRLPSYGRFFTAAQARYWFGIVRSVSFPGVVMDVDYIRYNTAANDSSATAKLQFMKHVGAAGSAAEHAVPEAMFKNPDLAMNDPAQPQGVSAVKTLAIAAAQGQKIYTLNQSNQALHGMILQSLQVDQDVKSEIANALAAGREVTVHDKDVTINGWTGSGYIILDNSDSGGGAYKIAGGSNGGILLIVAILSFGLGPLAFVFIGGAATAGGAMTAVGLIIAMVYSLNSFKGRVYDILSRENIRDDERQGSIKAISFFAIVSNMLSTYSALNEKEMYSAAWTIIASQFGKIFDGIAKIFDSAREE